MSKGKWTDAEIDEMVNRPDITHVRNKNPNFHYRHVERDDLRIEKMKREGYEIVTEEEGAVPDSPIAIESDGSSKVINLPMMVLMRRPKELHDKIVEKRRDRFEHLSKIEEEEALEDVKRDLKKIGVTGKLKRRLESVNRDFNI